MVLVEVGTVVVLTTGKTTTTGVLAVLADTTVTGGDVAAVFASLAEAGGHFLEGRVSSRSCTMSGSVHRRLCEAFRQLPDSTLTALCTPVSF
jgi:hypothetical protein